DARPWCLRATQPRIALLPRPETPLNERRVRASSNGPRFENRCDFLFLETQSAQYRTGIRLAAGGSGPPVIFRRAAERARLAHQSMIRVLKIAKHATRLPMLVIGNLRNRQH